MGYYMVIFEPNNIQIKRQIIALENLPQSFDGVKIVQLSDFHSYWFGRREKKVLEMLEEISPDFVFITGDFIDPVTKIIRRVDSAAKFWAHLGNRYENRIFGVLGNHDTSQVKNLLERGGIVVLNNEDTKLWLDNDFIYLIGVDDSFTDRDDLTKAIEKVEAGAPKILLAHAGEIIDEAVKEKIDLVLVGHTHGGQVNLPILGRLIQPLSEYGRRYMSGLFKIESTYLYVNRGIGTSVIPVRFNCPPEITLIELRK